MKTDLYINDPEEGITRATSHPRFVQYATDDFYYDCTDEFSPFGSDDGDEVLSHLEEWYEDDGQDDDVLEFADSMIDSWGFTNCVDYMVGSSEALKTWLADNEMNERFLRAACIAYISSAFGQFKITGSLTKPLAEKAIQALECLLLCNEFGRTSHPDWEYHDLEKERLLSMRNLLREVTEL